MSQKILVIDDDRMNLKMAEMILSKSGYEVKTAASGKEGIACLEQENVQLILLDVQMPEIDGIETMKQIRNIEKFMEIPIIFLSGSDDEETVEITKQMGAADYVTKPFVPKKLLEIVENNIR